MLRQLCCAKCFPVVASEQHLLPKQILCLRNKKTISEFFSKHFTFQANVNFPVNSFGKPCFGNNVSTVADEKHRFWSILLSPWGSIQHIFPKTAVRYYLYMNAWKFFSSRATRGRGRPLYQRQLFFIYTGPNNLVWQENLGMLIKLNYSNARITGWQEVMVYTVQRT